MEIGAGTFVRVISNFESNVNGDLNLIDGDIVKVRMRYLIDSVFPSIFN